MGAPQCTLPGLLGRGWVRLAFGPAGPACGCVARTAVALRLERCARRATRTPKGRRAALASERPLRGDEGVDVLFDTGRAPRLAALGELDSPSRPMSRLRGLIGGELKPRRLERPMIGGVLERRQPIAALDLSAGELCPGFVRTQRRLARFARRRPRDR